MKTGKQIELTVRVNLLALAALALVIWLCVALAGCSEHAPARPVTTVAGCTTAFEVQIRYSEARHLVHPDLPLPAACAGLTYEQHQQASLAAVIATMP
jgi:hypothetical protein